MVPVLSVPLPFGCSTLLPACLESLEPLLLLCCLLVNPFFLTIHVSIVIGDQLRLFNHAAELQRGKNLNNKLSSVYWHPRDIDDVLLSYSEITRRYLGWLLMLDMESTQV